MAQPLRRIEDAGFDPQRSARRRFKFRRRHTPHFYLVVGAVAGASCLCLVDAVAYVLGGTALGVVAFGMTLLASVLVFAAYFWGFFMVMNGNIPVARMKVFLPHAVVGTLSPLVYMLNVSLLFDTLGSGPLPGWALALAVLSLSLLAVQFLMGRRVVRVERPRVLKLHAR